MCYRDLERACLPLMSGYQSDLTKHDRAEIESTPDVPFLHYTRAQGTHLVRLLPNELLPSKGKIVPYLFGTADREHIVKQVLKITELFCKPSGLDALAVHYFDGKRLHKITADKAHSVARDYAYDLYALWDKNARRASA
jgi:hypothetical protein